MRKLHALLLPVVLFALASCLYACGDSDSNSDKETIVGTIVVALTRTNPGDCTELMTQAFAEQWLSDVESCEQSAEAEESPNPPVEVSDVEVDGSKASADVTFTENTLAGQTLTMALVEEDGVWKLDEIVRFARLDPSRLADEMAENLESGENPTGPRAIACIRRAFGEKSRSELEELFIGGSDLPLLKTLSNCEGKR